MGSQTSANHIQPTSELIHAGPFGVSEDAARFVLWAELSGLKDNMEVRISDSVLTVSGEFGHDTVQQKFEHRFPLPETIVHDAIRATYASGALVVMVPKRGDERVSQGVAIH